jgi:hypothetical protein
MCYKQGCCSPDGADEILTRATFIHMFVGLARNLGAAEYDLSSNSLLKLCNKVRCDDHGDQYPSAKLARAGIRPATRLGHSPANMQQL